MAGFEVDLLAIDRGSVTAPAGCGKTHHIAEALTRHGDGKPILILTHTNAGVVALRAARSCWRPISLLQAVNYRRLGDPNYLDVPAPKRAQPRHAQPGDSRSRLSCDPPGGRETPLGRTHQRCAGRQLLQADRGRVPGLQHVAARHGLVRGPSPADSRARRSHASHFYVWRRDAGLGYRGTH